MEQRPLLSTMLLKGLEHSCKGCVLIAPTSYSCNTPRVALKQFGFQQSNVLHPDTVETYEAILLQALCDANLKLPRIDAASAGV